jgi:glutamate synthase (NADPH) small chain
MGKVTGFLRIARKEYRTQAPHERIGHYREFVERLPEEELALQGARCMDCGIPFCHHGCPVNNVIPDWNDLTYQGRWREALDVLHSTNNFPEFTGRVCPAPCEASCTLNIVDDPVTIKSIECAIIDKAWEEGWIVPTLPEGRTGRTVAVVGSGPSGLACAQQLASVGHDVTVFERNATPGGLLTYGIPDFKLEKRHIARRVEQMTAEGVVFRTNCEVGTDIAPSELVEDFDAVVLAGGSEHPRDLEAPGRELGGIHFAMDFLTQQNRRIAGEPVGPEDEILATDKHVVVIGGGDTGSDCIGTSWRQGAKSVTQLEIMPRPPQQEDKGLTWPEWPLKMRTSSSQEEGGEREWSVATESFSGEDDQVRSLHGVRLTPRIERIEGTEFEIRADLVLLAMGFVRPVHDGMLDALGVDYDARGNVAADTEQYKTSADKVFSAGDMRRGQSLVVWAIREGRQCARAVDEYLMGSTELPR